MKINTRLLLNKFQKKESKLSKPLKKIFDIEYKKNRTNFLSVE